MLLDLTKPTMPVNPPAPTLPTPPPVRLVDIHGIPVPPPKTKEPSRFWCFFGVHKFEIKDESTWSITDNGTVLSKGPMYILRCPVCGKMKAERLGKK